MKAQEVVLDTLKKAQETLPEAKGIVLLTGVLILLGKIAEKLGE